MIKVTVVKSQGDASMVEYVDEGILQRATIPTSKIRNGEASKTTLSAGIPYGDDWVNKIGKIEVDPVVIANALRNRGIWTTADVLANPRKATLALQTALQLDLKKIFGGE